jgi:hypothetical protein
MNSLIKRNKKVLLLALVACVWAGCAGDRLMQYSSRKNVIERYPYLNDSTLQLSGIATDASYGWSERNPVRLGVKEIISGAKNAEPYLRALLGPQGEQVQFQRGKACCPFKTVNFSYLINIPGAGARSFHEKYGMLEVYHLQYQAKGLTREFTLYINVYDQTDKLLAPQGFTCKIP